MRHADEDLPSYDVGPTERQTELLARIAAALETIAGAFVDADDRPGYLYTKECGPDRGGPS